MLKDKFFYFKESVKRLEEVLAKKKDVYIRDSAIKRFELVYELAWKTLKEYFKEQGLEVRNSPRGCFKQAFESGLLGKDDEGLDANNKRS